MRMMTGGAGRQSCFSCSLSGSWSAMDRRKRSSASCENSRRGGVLFKCVVAGAREPGAPSGPLRVDRELSMPVIHDPVGRVARQLGVDARGDVVVLGADGQVFYSAPLGDAIDVDEPGRSESLVRGLESVLDAILAGEMPLAALHEPLTPSSADVPVPTGARPATEVTFARHVAPLLYEKCVSCHRPGEVAPFSLVSYKDAAKRASVLYEAASSGRMPPWKPHPGVGLFLDAERLSASETGITPCVVGDRLQDGRSGRASGAAEVCRRLAARPARPGPRTCPNPFAFPPTGRTSTARFACRFRSTDDVTVNGVEFRPGNRRVVHHSRIYLDDTGDARRRDRDDPAAGLYGLVRDRRPFRSSVSGPGGVDPRDDPAVRARRRRPRDSPRVGCGLASPLSSDRQARDRQVEHRALLRRRHRRPRPWRATRSAPTGSTSRLARSGTRSFSARGSRRTSTSTRSCRTPTIFCREFRLAATLPDGTTRAVALDHRLGYGLARPVSLRRCPFRYRRGRSLPWPPTSITRKTTHGTPTSPPRRVRYGVETKDEMCACHLEFLCDDPNARSAYTQKSPFGL